MNKKIAETCVHTHTHTVCLHVFTKYPRQFFHNVISKINKMAYYTPNVTLKTFVFLPMYFVLSLFVSQDCKCCVFIRRLLVIKLAYIFQAQCKLTNANAS
jgi:hypothetical protein